MSDPHDPLPYPVDDPLADWIDPLASLDGPADESTEWPASLWSTLVQMKAPLWAVPESFGGDGLERADLVRRNALLAEGSLTAAFILTQHDAAVRRLAGAAQLGHPQAADWLERIVRGDAFATVGLSQLTTSRRRGPRALRASRLPGGAFRLDGSMPWVTAAARAHVLVAGALLDDDSQILVAVPADREGLKIGPPLPLAALQSSCTAEVLCDGLEVPPDDVLFGPAPDVLSLSTGGGGTGGLETSSLALGLSRAALRRLRSLSPDRDELAEPLEALEAAWRDVSSLLFAASEAHSNSLPPTEIRRRANALVLRSTQAYLTARKGSGFLRSEPAQRYARQALFFLVWSCPGPVAQAALMDFAGLCPA